MNKDDIKNEGVEAGSTVTLANEFGQWTVRMEVSDTVPRGVILTYSAPWPKLMGGSGPNFLTTDFTQRYGGNSAFNSTFVRLA